MTHETFPHESTGDQWFSEAQFESYRKLGSHIIDTICNYQSAGAGGNDLADPDLAQFLKKAAQGAAEIDDGAWSRFAELSQDVAAFFKRDQ